MHLIKLVFRGFAFAYQLVFSNQYFIRPSNQHVYSNQYYYLIFHYFPTNTFIQTNMFIQDSRVDIKGEKCISTLVVTIPPPVVSNKVNNQLFLPLWFINGPIWEWSFPLFKILLYFNDPYH